MPTGASATTLLALEVLDMAGTGPNGLSTSWSEVLTQTTPLGTKLSISSTGALDGQTYFLNVIPNLRSMAPSVFSSGAVTPDQEPLDYSTAFGATMTNGAAPLGGTVFGSPITFTPSITYGIADSGSVTTLIDSALTQADDYWNGAKLTIINTTDGAAPVGHIATVADFDDAANRLTFAAMTAAIGAGDTYQLCTGSHGIADSGTATTLVDSALNQANNYWTNARLTIVTTTDGAAPQGETATVTGFSDANDRLTFAALTAAVGEGDTYTLGFTSVNVTATGTFTIVLTRGTVGVLVNNTGVATGSPISLVAGTNNVTVTGNGLFTVALYTSDAQSTAADKSAGSGFDMSGVADKFGMSTGLFSGLVWIGISLYACAKLPPEMGKSRMMVFDVMMVGGGVMSFMPLLLPTLLFIGAGVFIGYIIFFRTANV
jgi:hypothetical protein